MSKSSSRRHPSDFAVFARLHASSRRRKKTRTAPYKKRGTQLFGIRDRVCARASRLARHTVTSASFFSKTKFKNNAYCSRKTTKSNKTRHFTITITALYTYSIYLGILSCTVVDTVWCLRQCVTPALRAARRPPT